MLTADDEDAGQRPVNEACHSKVTTPYDEAQRTAPMDPDRLDGGGEDSPPGVTVLQSLQPSSVGGDASKVQPGGNVDVLQESRVESVRERHKLRWASRRALAAETAETLTPRTFICEKRKHLPIDGGKCMHVRKYKCVGGGTTTSRALVSDLKIVPPETKRRIQSTIERRTNANRLLKARNIRHKGREIPPSLISNPWPASMENVVIPASDSLALFEAIGHVIPKTCESRRNVQCPD